LEKIISIIIKNYYYRKDNQEKMEDLGSFWVTSAKFIEMKCVGSVFYIVSLF